jgi:hypothetical protein
MMQVLEAESFFKDHQEEMFYVGFLKSPEVWFPLCLVSSPEEKKQLDTLFLSHSYQAINETLESYAQQVSQVQEIFVQYLLPSEIQNLIERYGLEHVALISTDEEVDGCDCGCGCS